MIFATKRYLSSSHLSQSSLAFYRDLYTFVHWVDQDSAYMFFSSQISHHVVIFWHMFTVYCFTSVLFSGEIVPTLRLPKNNPRCSMYGLSIYIYHSAIHVGKCTGPIVHLGMCYSVVSFGFSFTRWVQTWKHRTLGFNTLWPQRRIATFRYPMELYVFDCLTCTNLENRWDIILRSPKFLKYDTYMAGDCRCFSQKPISPFYVWFLYDFCTDFGELRLPKIGGFSQMFHVPIGSMCGTFTYNLVDVSYGKCGYIDHAWSFFRARGTPNYFADFTEFVKPWSLHLFHGFLSYVGRMMASWLNREEDLLRWSCWESWYQVDEIHLYTHTIHVWYIYLHENHNDQPNVGKQYTYIYISYMDGMGYAPCILHLFFLLIRLFLFHGFHPMGFITVFHHHLGEYGLDLFHTFSRHRTCISWVNIPYMEPLR